MEQALKGKDDLSKIQKLPIIHPTNPNKKLTEKEDKHLRELVTYEFMNIEQAGLEHTFSYGNASNKHVFTFKHGDKYKVPRFIARHIDSRSTPMWGWKPDGSGRLIKTQKGRDSRFQMREVYQ